MGVRRAPKPITDADIPAVIARDTETAAAVAAHTAATDPHPQYLLERLLPLLLQKVGQESFDANNWNPNTGQAHSAAINVIFASNFRIDSSTGGYVSALSIGLPAGQKYGLLIEINPVADQGEAISKSQIFIGSGVWWRSLSNSDWSVWYLFAGTNCANVFSQVQSFPGGLDIGSPGTSITRILSQTYSINPPNVVANGLYTQDVSLTGSRPGDFCQIVPISIDLYTNSIWPFQFTGVVISPNIIRLYLHNAGSVALDLGSFQVRVMVMGF